MPDNNACWPSNGEIDIMEMVHARPAPPQACVVRPLRRRRGRSTAMACCTAPTTGAAPRHAASAGAYPSLLRQPNGWCGDKPHPHPSIGNETAVGECCRARRLHPRAALTPPWRAGADWATAWHEYAVEYSPEHIAWLIDGRVYQNLTKSSTSPRDNDTALFFDVPSAATRSPPHPLRFPNAARRRYYLILNTALGGDGSWPRPTTNTTAMPIYHRIEYVRVSQPHESAH